MVVQVFPPPSESANSAFLFPGGLARVGSSEAVATLTFNLRRGRFFLLIVGDGIREGVEAITDYLQAQAGLHFTLVLVEMPIYKIDDGRRIVVPRVLARTQNIIRTVVAAPPWLRRR